MKKWLLLVALAITTIGLWVGCWGGASPTPLQPGDDKHFGDPYLKSADVELPGEYVPDEILVLFKQEVPQSVIDQINQRFGMEVIRVTSVTKVYQLKIPSNLTVPDAVNQYRALAEVLEVSPNYYMKIAGIPDDSFFNQQWNFHNKGQFIPSFGFGTADADIDAPEAWDIQTGSSSIQIAILDTGIDQDHPELASKIIWNANHIGAPSGVDDFQGHGTHVAGTAAAIGNNAGGVAGACWGCQLMNMKVLDDYGSGTSVALIAAIDDCVDEDPAEPDFGFHPQCDIISGSLSGAGTCGSVAGLQASINSAFAEGVILVFAAGNSNANLNASPEWPATCNNVVTVASTTNTDARSGFSNFGANFVEIAAPGSAIESTAPNHPNNIGYRYYGIISGTSMATPLVSGALGVIWSQFPALTNQQVINRMCLRADRIAGTGPNNTDNWFCGRLNLFRALQ
ncbi:MAG: S8 family peptidase [bacterium JZ-2024 1]